MGIHADTLLGIAKGEELRDWPWAQDGLQALVQHLVLVDLQQPAVAFDRNLDPAEQGKFMNDHMDLSDTFCGHPIGTPFPATAIEDREGVVCLEHQGEGNYRFTSVSNTSAFDNLTQGWMLNVGMVRYVGRYDSDGYRRIAVRVQQTVISFSGEGRRLLQGEGHQQMQALGMANNVEAYLKEAVYLAAPNTFFLEVQGARLPTFHCRRLSELLPLFRQAGTAITLQPGYWGIPKQQGVCIPQHISGEPDVEIQGIHYHLHRKLTPFTLQPA